MRKNVLLLLFLVIPVFVFAQKNILTISGKILDGELQDPLPYANVQLFSLPDSTYLRGSISELNGNFSISSNIKPGEYFLRISFIGYLTTEKKISIPEKKESVNVGRVILNVDAVLLEEAVVVAEAVPILIKEDTTVFSASAFRVTDGAMIEELIKKLPGAEISDDGKITVNGKEIKKIIVDGKEFFSEDPNIILKNLPANIVENVKSYDRKSDAARLTGVDDDDDEAVLDLTVKKGMKQGWFGNILGGGGYGGDDFRYEAGGMISRFKDDANLSVIASINNTNNKGFSEFGDSGFGVKGNAGSGITSSNIIGATFAQNFNKAEFGGNVQYGYSDNDARRIRKTETFLENGSSYGADTSTTRRKRDDVAVNFRLKWKPDSMTTITFRPNFTYAHTRSLGDGTSRTYNTLYNPVNEKYSHDLTKGNNITANGNLQFVRKLNNNGRNISVNARMDYTHNESDNYSESQTHFYFYDDEDGFANLDILDLNRYTDKKSNGYTYRIQAAYTEPIFRNHYLQFKYAFQQRISEADSYVFNEENEVSYIDSLSSKVKNKYNTHQIEAGLQGKYSKLNYNAGFSVNPQSSKSETSVGPNVGKNLEQQVVNFSPNLMFRYRFNKQHTFMLRYRGQSSAPNVEYLQEVIDQGDPLDLKFGNPDLKPSYRNNVTLRYSNFLSESQRSYSLNGTFSNTLNAVTSQVNYNSETGGKESYMVNVNGNWNANAFFTFSTPFRNRKYTLSSTTQAGYADNVSYANEDRLGVRKSTTHTLNLKERLVGNYRSDLFDVSLNASIAYMLTQNSIRKNNNRETFNYEFGGNTNINLPWNMYLSTDITYRILSGYTDGFSNNEVMWNAQLSKNFLKNNAATIRLKVYDILQQQQSLTRTISDNMMSDTEYNTLGSYFMVHFVYRINTLGKSASSSSPMPVGGGRERGSHGGEGRMF